MKKLLVGALAALLLAGCAAQRAFDNGRNLFEQGRVEEGLSQMDKAYRLEPDNSEFRSQYYKRREAAVYQWLSQAEAAKYNSNWEEAENLYQRILHIDPDNPRAKVGLTSLAGEKKHMQLLGEARAQFDKGEVAEAAKEVRSVLSDSPSHPTALKLKREIEGKLTATSQIGTIFKSKLARPITIEFKDAPIRAVFDSISKVAGVNFLFDKDVRPDLRTNLLVRDARIEDVIRFILVTNQLKESVLSSNTLFIYPNTPDKLRDFQELQSKSFYLTNANAKDVAAVLKSQIKPKDINVVDSLNMIMVRDTADVIRVAERLIAAQDIAEPEVMLEVEVLEVGTNLLDSIGLQYPSQLSFSLVGAAGTAGTAKLSELRNRNSGMVRVSLTDPAFVVNMLHQDGESNLLANPRIRVKNHEKANIHIGDKVPVITNTTTSTGLVAESVTYLDVGLKLDVEPTIYLDNDVGIKVGLEVSNIVKQIQNTNGSLTYQIGTRNASTVLRLKDGETQILAGLINKEDRKSGSGIPGLGQLPILGHLFSSRSDTASKTEIVLLITPRVVRNIVRPESAVEEFPSGTTSLVSLDRLEINQADAGETISQAEPENPSYSGTVQRGTSPAMIGAAPVARTAVPIPDDAIKQPDTPTPIPALGNVQLSLDSPAQASVGKPFTVKINATAIGLQNALMDMSYDPAQLKVMSVLEGDLLNKPDGKTQFMQQVQDKSGRINLGVIRQGNVQGEGTLASVTFQPLTSATGATQLRVGAANFSDATGRVLPVNSLPTATVGIAK
ncbi:MAG: general secretion pathway protein GspD [Gammaproteobacteria bacterium]|nr:general secretion pathway protein GspD [Gammaproteobacteria bacterium]